MEDRLEQLSQLKLERAFWHSVVFVAGEHLLLGERSNQGTEIVELSSGLKLRTPLERASQLLPQAAHIDIGCWCADDERVCVWDKNSKDILVYSVC